MTNLDPVVTPLLGSGAGLAVYFMLKFMEFVRRGRVETIDTIIARQADENKRLKEDLDKSEEAEELRRQERDQARTLLFREREYTSMLVAQLRREHLTPVSPPADHEVSDGG